MLRLARIGVPLGVAVALVAAAQGSALAATTQVSIVNFAFNPTPVTVKVGDTVNWTNTSTTTHTTTSDGTDVCCPNGPALWASGNLVANAQFPFVFNVAGAYKYHCSIHTTMHGQINVKGNAMPRTGTTTTHFTIVWAKTAIPAGYVVNVQISRPGQGFVNFLTGTTLLSTTFTPDAGTGTYKFRAQLQKSGSGTLKSGFSPAISITVS
jgi:plastocyanin